METVPRFQTHRAGRAIVGWYLNIEDCDAFTPRLMPLPGHTIPAWSIGCRMASPTCRRLIFMSRTEAISTGGNRNVESDLASPSASPQT
jgi:hypothetical protein